MSLRRRQLWRSSFVATVVPHLFLQGVGGKFVVAAAGGYDVYGGVDGGAHGAAVGGVFAGEVVGGAVVGGSAHEG